MIKSGGAETNFREIPPKCPPHFLNHFFRFLARALAPRQKSEKMPSFTAEPATHSAEPATHSAGILAEIPPKFRPKFLNHFFRFLARALAPRQKSEKMPSFTAEPATHSAEPATHSAGIFRKFVTEGN